MSVYGQFSISTVGSSNENDLFNQNIELRLSRKMIEIHLPYGRYLGSTTEYVVLIIKVIKSILLVSAKLKEAVCGSVAVLLETNVCYRGWFLFCVTCCIATQLF